MKAAIDAVAVSVIKDKQAVLNKLNFTVEAGSLTGLIGPSGSGKTTLMRSIVGVQMVSSGELRVLGERAGSAGLRSRIGYVSQEPAIYGDLTVLQNLRYFAALVGASKADVRQTIQQLDLEKQASHLVSSLSGGQRARVSLGVALLSEADLLVLDEPTVGLDPVLRESLWQLFAQLAQTGKTLLISSHVMDEAERCQNILLLRDGQLLWQESRARLLESTHTTEVEQAFLQLVKGTGNAR